MDIDHRDDEAYEPRPTLNEFENWKKRPLSHGLESEQPSNPPDLVKRPVKPLPRLKWKRLQRQYNDQYLDLFREYVDSRLSENANAAFSTSQIGASMWQAAEKAMFFDALARRGRHDLPGIAKAIGTKSQLEVKVYLDLLQNSELDRQLFENDTKNISQVEYPAAIEIGAEMEESLDVAADALAAFQEQYDFAVARQEQEKTFLIDWITAATYDEQADRLEQSAADDHETEDPLMQNGSTKYLFRLGNFLQLTEHLYMNGSEQDPSTHWNYIAEDDEEPAISQTAILEFADIVTNLVRRVAQTALFLTQSRIQATRTEQHSALEVVKVQDIHAALDVLGMPHDSFKHWIGFARRHNARVVSGWRGHGHSQKRSISYEEVEKFLASQRTRGRTRFRSIISDVSGAVGSSAPESHVSSASDEEESTGSENEMSEETDGDGEQSQELSESSEEGDQSSESDLKPLMTTMTTRQRLENEMDAYLETVDQQARHREESRLRHLLGLDDEREIDVYQDEVGRRPKVLRKTINEVKIWTSQFEAAWESLPGASQ